MENYLQHSRSKKNVIGVLLRNDIRLEDNQAFSAALQEAKKNQTLPVVIISDDSQIGHIRYTQARLAYESRAQKVIKGKIEASSGDCIIVNGNDIPKAVTSLGITRLYANIQISDNIGFQRDRELIAFAKASGIKFTEFLIDNVERCGTGIKKHKDGLFITSSKDLSPFQFTKKPEAMLSLCQYIDRLEHADYRKYMWVPGPDKKASSRLSVALASGTISSDRVLYEAQKKASISSQYAQKPYNEYIARLHWRSSFFSMLEKNVQAFPWGAMREERQNDANITKIWLSGETGYPLVDAAMRDLTKNGWINFRLRQVLLSFAVDLIDLDFHKAGVAMGNLFDDYCPGIHWCQVALQSGMIQGRGPRVINPTKQLSDLDPQALYCRKWLPWMKNVPMAYSHEPWKWDEYKGPKPIIHYAEASKKARDKYK